EMPKICTRCLLKDFSKEDYDKIIVSGLSALPAGELVSDEVTAKRLEICKDCEKINQGTCLACGCYVEIRAATRKGKCPYSKW
ncbi:MAG: DUF6171 family protein, partial [Saccharofermentans sp.]|nr:DUF6171 family protein [Saccharofermentans sp.]